MERRPKGRRKGDNMNINISEETANAIVKALEKQAAASDSTIAEIAAARDALAVMHEFITEEIGDNVYLKLVGLYGIAERYAYFRNVGVGCFEFTGDIRYASKLTREEAAKELERKGYYINLYNARDMIVERA